MTIRNIPPLTLCGLAAWVGGLGGLVGGLGWLGWLVGWLVSYLLLYLCVVDICVSVIYNGMLRVLLIRKLDDMYDG